MSGKKKKMKFRNLSEFAKKLDLLRMVLKSDLLTPIFTCIEFDQDSISAYNGVMLVTLSHECGIRGTVDGAVLTNFARTVSGDEYSLECDDDELVMRVGRSVCKLPVLKELSVPDADSLGISADGDGDGALRIRFTDEAMNRLELCAASAGSQSLVYDKAGVMVRARDDGSVEAVSTDNSTLTVAKICDCERDGECPAVALLEDVVRYVTKASRLLKVQSVLTVTAKQASVELGDFGTVHCAVRPVDDDSFGAIDNVVAGIDKTVQPWTLDFDSLLDCSRRALSVATVSDEAIDSIKSRLSIDGGLLTMRTSCSNGEVVDTIDVPKRLGKFACDLDARKIDGASSFAERVWLGDTAIKLSGNGVVRYVSVMPCVDDGQ